jgi:hypothetical protein
MKLVMSDGTEYDIASGETTLGRAPGNDIRLNSAKVSGNHAIIRMQGDQLILQDLNSTNGSYINEGRVKGSQTFQPGDQLRLGDTVIVVRADVAKTMVDMRQPAAPAAAQVAPAPIPAKPPPVIAQPVRAAPAPAPARPPAMAAQAAPAPPQAKPAAPMPAAPGAKRLYRCPVCGKQVETIKYFTMGIFLFLYIGASWRMKTESGCPSCIRKKIYLFLAVNLLTANITWPFVILPMGIFHLIRSFGKD